MTTQQEATTPTPPGSAVVRERIALAMWRAQISQVEMAGLLGITQSTFSKKIRGRTPLTVEELLAIAGRLGVSASMLLAGAEQEEAGELMNLVRHQGLEPRTRWFGARQGAKADGRGVIGRAAGVPA